MPSDGLWAEASLTSESVAIRLTAAAKACSTRAVTCGRTAVRSGVHCGGKPATAGVGIASAVGSCLSTCAGSDSGERLPPLPVPLPRPEPRPRLMSVPSGEHRVDSGGGRTATGESSTR